jgi:hypothetical protein
MMMSPLAIQIPAICIPRINYRVTNRILYGTFEALFGKGCISDLHMIPRYDNKTWEPYHVAFIYFNAYTPRPMIPRSGSVSPELELLEQGVVETAEATGDHICDRITSFITNLEATGEVRIEYRSPYYFKVRKYVPRKKQVPRILPSVADPDV